jgi:hypothetical protein
LSIGESTYIAKVRIKVEIYAGKVEGLRVELAPAAPSPQRGDRAAGVAQQAVSAGVSPHGPLMTSVERF